MERMDPHLNDYYSRRIVRGFISFTAPLFIPSTIDPRHRFLSNLTLRVSRWISLRCKHGNLWIHVRKQRYVDIHTSQILFDVLFRPYLRVRGTSFAIAG